MKLIKSYVKRIIWWIVVAFTCGFFTSILEPLYNMKNNTTFSSMIQLQDPQSNYQKNMSLNDTVEFKPRLLTTNDIESLNKILTTRQKTKKPMHTVFDKDYIRAVIYDNETNSINISKINITLLIDSFRNLSQSDIEADVCVCFLHVSIIDNGFYYSPFSYNFEKEKILQKYTNCLAKHIKDVDNNNNNHISLDGYLLDSHDDIIESINPLDKDPLVHPDTDCKSTYMKDLEIINNSHKEKVTLESKREIGNTIYTHKVKLVFENNDLCTISESIHRVFNIDDTISEKRHITTDRLILYKDIDKSYTIVREMVGITWEEAVCRAYCQKISDVVTDKTYIKKAI